MPYTIVVNRPGYLPEQEPYAVATLEEARVAAAEEVRRSYESYRETPGERHYVAAAQALGDAGGVIGPVAGGYVIDVTHVTYAELRKLAGLEGVELYGLRDERREQILAVYNAAH